MAKHPPRLPAVPPCRRRDPVCTRYQRTAELLGRRWSAAVIRVTLEGPARFTEIRSAVDGLSARLLSERLRELESAGLIVREVDPGSRAVVYRLTEKGAALSRVVREIETWADTWDPAPPRRAGTTDGRPRGRPPSSPL